MRTYSVVHSRAVSSSLLIAAVCHNSTPLLRRASSNAQRAAKRALPPRMAEVPPAGGGFEALGVSPLLLPSLVAAGITEPTEVQRAAFGAILSANDCVLLSETGSGKTLAYALPLLHQILTSAVDDDDDDAAASVAADGAEDDASPPSPPRRPARPANQALVLLPNRDLCTQVLSVFDGLIAALPAAERAGLYASSLVARAGADVDAPIVISTPSYCLNTWRGPDAVRWVVLDEADALLAGSFKPAARSQYPIERIIAAVKRSAKLEALESGQALAGPRVGRGKDARRPNLEERASLLASKQFIVVGATMPNAGTKNAEAHVKRLFPLAQWYRAASVHSRVDQMEHYFVKIDDAMRGGALRQALRHGPEGQALVFANTVPTAEDAFEEASLELGDESCALFHAKTAPEERERLLTAFSNGELRALVCTGLASRGIDFADVQHVVQYEVATNAVEFIHRVGRTARAGKGGVCTTLYADDRADLVEALRDALSEGRPVEHLFSRKRSFRLRRKKEERRHGQWEDKSE